MKTATQSRMTKQLIALAMTLAAFACPVAAQTPARAKAFTPPSSIMAQDGLKKYYEIPNFRIGGKYDLDASPETWRNGGQGGTTLESLGAAPLRVAYIAVGTPRKNDKGEITNAFIINTFYSGDSTWMYNTWYEGQPANAFSGGAIVGPGRTIDTNRFYVVFLDALGLWGASKPSDGLGPKFPKYSYFDMVQSNYQLLRDHLKVAQVEVATGASMGGTQAWVWGVMYSPSGYVKAIMPIGGTTASDGDDPVGQWTFRLAQAAIESDPVWRKTNGDYYKLPLEQHPKTGLVYMWSILQLTGLTFPVRSATPWSTLQKEVFYWQPKGDESITYINRVKAEDPVDYWYRNDSGFNYNINKELKRIKARTLVVHVDNDQWLMVENARKAAGEVKGAYFASFPDPGAHYGVFKAPNILRSTIQSFAEDNFTVSLPGVGGAGAAATAAPAAKPAGLSK
jgi:homoserine acetyltransferase